MANPPLHARHAAQVLLKYHVMEEQQQALEGLLHWTEGTPPVVGTLARAGLRAPPHASGLTWLAELVAVGALQIQEQVVHDV